MIDEVVSRYLELHSDDKEYLGQLIGQLAAHQTLDDRKNFEGHITGSAYVLSPDRSKLLVIHHRLFDKWLQPGGHWDKGESGPWVTAARETVEETGVSLDHQIITYGTDFRIPFYINTHRIKNRPHKHEP
jgi:8-oxo-dGTP pyrophosphatase MutT (NUDIX family)